MIAPSPAAPLFESNSLTLETLGLTPEAVSALPAGMRRQLARFLLRWGRADLVLPLLPPHDPTPRDQFERCRALLGAGDVDAARELAKSLVNDPAAGHWGHRAVGEVFLALGKGDRADERFRAGSDPLGRARAWTLLGNAATALDHLRDTPPDDPEAEAARRDALRLQGAAAAELDEVDAHLRTLFEEERRELLETLGPVSGLELAGAPTDPDVLRAALAQVFGYDDFRAGQLDVILPLMRGESVLGLMPTGAGKSICFQLPAALLPGATVVISPLIALMKDQVDGLPPHLYRRATLINSALEPGEADRRLEAVARGEVSLLYAAPERLRQRSFVRALQRRGVSLFVIDEAHCVSLWGHDFRPDYFFIGQVLRDLGRPTVLALTATATPEMQDDIGRQLETRFQKVNLGTFRPNLKLSVLRLSGEADKWNALLRLLKEEKGPAILYVDRRKLAEDLSERLRGEGIPAEAYHAGLGRDARDAAQSRFMLGEVRVIAATVAFGMGVDKADVRTVIHFNLPRSLESYYQEAGRAGRDGLPARCVLLYTPNDKGNLTRRTNGDRLQANEVLSLQRLLARRLRAGGAAVSVEELEREWTSGAGSGGTRLRVAVSLLQGIGAVERGYDLPASVWVALRKDDPGRPRLERGGGEGAAGGASALPPFERFVAALDLERRGALSLPAAQAATAAGVPLEALETVLLDWEEAGWIRFRCGGRGMGLRPGPQADLQAEVGRLLKRMEEVDGRRLELLSGYLAAGECRQGYVSRYFGRELEEGCGECDNCRLIAAGGSVASRTARRGEDAASAFHPTEEESGLFELLRAWRREKAREESVPAYVIFHDRVLYAIARLRPKTLPALGDIPGVGRTKLQAWGDEVLAIVRQGE